MLTEFSLRGLVFPGYSLTMRDALSPFMIPCQSMTYLVKILTHQKVLW